MSEIKLGVKVRDRATCFTGTVIQKIDRIGGNRRWAVQPAGKEPKKGEQFVYPDAMDLDEHLLEVIDSKVTLEVTTPAPVVGLDLGNEMEDIPSGFKGIAIERALYINGCTFFLLQGKMIDGKLEGTQGWFSAVRLKKTGQGIAIPDVPKDPVSGKRPGGPATRSQRM